MDFVVQKATELGVAHILPVLSTRSVVRLDTRQSAAKLAHWRAVAISACEQCGRNRVPAIDEPRPLIEHLGAAHRAAGLRLVLEPDESDEPHGGESRISSSLAAAEPGRSRVEVAIGPEGGFAPEELAAFRVAGYVLTQLGPRVLRTETAAIAALAWLQTRFGDMSG
jgi:16S rRNA (uracil1498-N3)-methyltransferase